MQILAVWMIVIFPWKLCLKECNWCLLSWSLCVARVTISCKLISSSLVSRMSAYYSVFSLVTCLKLKLHALIPCVRITIFRDYSDLWFDWCLLMEVNRNHVHTIRDWWVVHEMLFKRNKVVQRELGWTKVTRNVSESQQVTCSLDPESEAKSLKLETGLGLC